MITSIIDAPYNPITSPYWVPLNTVYDPMVYVIDSTTKSRGNYKFLFDVYSSGIFRTRIKQNPDFNSSYGVGDIHRILENYVSPDFNYNLAGLIPTANSYERYQMKFGESYSRRNRFISTSNNSGLLQLTFSAPHNLRVSDGVYIDKDDKTVNSIYDGYHLVGYIVDAYNVQLAFGYGSVSANESGYVTETEHFIDNFYTTIGNNAYVGFIVNQSTNPTQINVGDTVIVYQYPTPTNPDYDGEWTVLQVDSVVVTGTTYDRIVINYPFQLATGAEPAYIFALNDYVFSGQVIDDYAFAFNGALTYEDYLSWNASQWVPFGSTSHFLTNAPKTQKIKIDEYATLSFFNGNYLGGLNGDYVRIATYNKNGTFIQFYDIINPFNNSTNEDEQRADVGIGPVNLSNLTSFDVYATGTTFPPNFNNIGSYTVNLGDSGSVAPYSETITFIIDDNCCLYDEFRFAWLNRKGGFDYFTFTQRSDKKSTTTKDMFDKKLGRITSGDWNYSIGDRGSTIFNVNSRDSYVVNSNWLTQAEATWLNELMSSPEVYWIKKTDNKAYPIIVTNQEYIEGNENNDFLFMVTITFEMSFSSSIQRG